MTKIIKKEKIQVSEDFQVYLSNFAMGKNTFPENLEESDKELALIYYLRNSKKRSDPQNF